MTSEVDEESDRSDNSDSPVKKTDDSASYKQKSVLSKEALEFAPGLLSIQEEPPSSLPRVVMLLVVLLVVITLIWMVIGRIDIVATANGVLLPQNYIKIVQPANNGIVEKILVQEDQRVHAGQVLLRMNTSISGAKSAMIQTQLHADSLKIRRLYAELNGKKLVRRAGDPPDMFDDVELQFHEHQRAYQARLMEARDGLRKTSEDLASARQKLVKLKKILPIIYQQAYAYEGMGKLGYVPMMDVDKKKRAYLEIQQNILSQKDTVASMAAAKEKAKRHVEDIISKHQSDLRDKLVKVEKTYSLMQQKWLEQKYRNGLLQLKAPVAGIVQKLATHTVGTVVSPGTVLVRLVPDNTPLVASLHVKNKDVGFIHIGQTVKVKIAAYPFEKYGYITGKIKDISPTSSTRKNSSQQKSGTGHDANNQEGNSAYQVKVNLTSQHLSDQGHRFKLIPGMQISADIVEGRHSVLSYLLSPIEKTIEQSGENG